MSRIYPFSPECGRRSARIGYGTLPIGQISTKRGFPRLTTPPAGGIVDHKILVKMPLNICAPLVHGFNFKGNLLDQRRALPAAAGAWQPGGLQARNAIRHRDSLTAHQHAIIGGRAGEADGAIGTQDAALNYAAIANAYRAGARVNERDFVSR